MWVDIFKKSHFIPPPIDISPREPVLYELRVVVWNTENVLPKDWSRATNEEMSDIYVKGQVECVIAISLPILAQAQCWHAALFFIICTWQGLSVWHVAMQMASEWEESTENWCPLQVTNWHWKFQLEVCLSYQIHPCWKCHRRKEKGEHLVRFY